MRYVLRTLEKPYKYVNLKWKLTDDIMEAQIYRKSTAYLNRKYWNIWVSGERKDKPVDMVEVKIKEVR